MTDAQQALAQVREALEAYPSQGEWYASGTVVYFARSGGFDLCDCPRPHANAAFIAKCNPANIAAILAHVEAKDGEIERMTEENRRLRADLLAGRNVVNAGLTIHALTIERDMLRQEIERLTAALRAQPGPVSMEDVEWAGKVHLAEAIRERDELRRQLAEAEQDARRYRWLRKIAHQNTAYDVYKDGAHWSVGLHSDDHRQTFDQAIDAAMGAGNE